MGDKRRISPWIGMLLIGALVVWLIFYMFGLGIGIVVGNSMYPTLRSGDLIIFKTLGKGAILPSLPLKQGDIVGAIVYEYLSDNLDCGVVGYERIYSVMEYRVVKRVVCILLPHRYGENKDIDEGSIDLHSCLVVLCGDNKEATASYIVPLSQVKSKIICAVPYAGALLCAFVVFLVFYLLLWLLLKMAYPTKGGN